MRYLSISNENKWKYLSFILMGIITTGLLAPSAFAANPTLEEVLANVLGIKAETDNLPADPASQTDTGVTKARIMVLNEQMGDASSISGITVIGNPFDGKNRSGHITVASLTSSAFTQPEIFLACLVQNSPFSATGFLLESSTTGLINTDFSCGQVTIGYRDVPDGADTPENILVDVQYVETDNVTPAS